MQKRTIFILLAAAFVLGLVAGAVLYGGSYAFALKRAGLAGAEVLDAGIDNNGDEYRAVVKYTEDNGIRLAYLTKNDFGLWKVWQQTDSAESGLASLGWTRHTGFVRYAAGDATEFQWEVHNVYAGNDAKGKIVIPPELLPPGAALDLHQAGERYVLHFVSYGDGEILNAVTLEKLQTLLGDYIE
ncbi:MAG: hypothetical protein ACSW8F_02215, partial [bacterium]